MDNTKGACAASWVAESLGLGVLLLAAAAAAAAAAAVGAQEVRLARLADEGLNSNSRGASARATLRDNQQQQQQ
jgi:hypothetical protein